MAIRAKPCDCECASQSNACDCGSPCALDCRQKTGFAAICGFSEFTDPSDPPKKYRTVTNTGSLRSRIFQPSLTCDVGAVINDVTTDYSGAGIYDRLTCEVDCSAIVNGNCGEVQGPTGTTQTTTKTESTATGNGCRVTSGIQSQSVDGVWVNSLSQEDTEVDGIARAEQAIAEWTNCAEGNSAYITDRTGSGGFVYAFRHVQTRAMWTAEVGRTYNVRINFARRLLGSSGLFLDLGAPWESTLVATEIMEKASWVDIPNEAGWETVASSCALELVP